MVEVILKTYLVYFTNNFTINKKPLTKYMLINGLILRLVVSTGLEPVSKV
jgi:hypothetical protein